MLLDFTYEKSNDWYRNEWLPMTQKMISEEWQAEIFDFLNEWFSDKNEFEIKSSGTTGPPKTEFYSRESFITSAQITIDSFDLTKGKTLLMCLPMNFVAGKMMLVRAIVGRMNLFAIQPTSNPIEDLKYPISFAAFTPHQLQSILKTNPNKIELIEKVIIGGSPVSNELQKQISDSNTQFFETFGMSETLTHVATKMLNGRSKSDYFKVLKGFIISTDDNDQLLIKADHLENSPLRTSDIVEMIDSEKFKWLGRSNDVINSGGVKLFPSLIEKKICNIINREFFIGKQNDKNFGECVILFIEGEPFNKKELTELNNGITKLLAKYEVPKEIIFKNEFPRNKNGKVKRSDVE